MNFLLLHKTKSWSIIMSIILKTYRYNYNKSSYDVYYVIILLKKDLSHSQTIIVKTFPCILY